MKETLLEVARSTLWNQYHEAGRALKAIPGVGSGPMGLTPDAVKSTPAYADAQRQLKAAFAALRAFNAKFPRPKAIN